MAVTSGYSLGSTTSYVAVGVNVTLTAGSYKNTTTTDRVISTVKLGLGTGVAGTFYYPGNDSATANGQPFTATISCGSTKSNSVKITKVVHRHSAAQIPIRNECDIYAFTFSPGITVKPNQTVTFTFNASTNASGGGAVVCFTNRRTGEGNPTSYDGTATRNEFDVVDSPTGFTITWDAQGGYFPDNSSTKQNTNVPAGSDMSKYIPQDPEIPIPGVVFKCWTTDTAGNSPIPTKTEAKNVTYYAQYTNQYRVHFQLNNGTSPSHPGLDAFTQYCDPGDNVKFPWTDLKRSGYEFQGWKDLTTNEIHSELAYTVTNVQRDYNFAAEWKRAITGQLHYDTQGGTPIPPDQDLTSDPDSHKVNDKIIPEKKIHVYFKVVETGGTGPNPSDVTLTMPLDYYRPDRGVSKFKPGDSVPMSWKDGTLTAIYKDATFTSMSLPQDPKHPKGLRFIGWATQRSGAGNIGTKSSNTLPISLSSDTTYYAIWEQKFEYDPNGGTPNGGSPGNPITYKRIEQERSSTGIVLKTQAETFPDSVEQFLGWDTDKTATTPSYSPGDKYTGSASVMYAIWKKKDVKVTFDYKGGYDSNNSPGPKTVVVKYGGSATPPSGMHWKSQGDKPKKEFQGWMGKYKNVTYNTTVYALWEGSPVKIWTGTQWIPYFAGVALSEWEGSN